VLFCGFFRRNHSFAELRLNITVSFRKMAQKMEMALQV
jgi:hypothetical protein